MKIRLICLLLVCAMLTLLLAGCQKGENDMNTPVTTSEEAFTPLSDADADLLTEKWRAAELCLEATRDIDDPFDSVLLDARFTSPSGKVYTVPAFWDGGRIWRVRFAPNELGLWRCETVCNLRDTGLDGLSYTLGCNPYAGELEIYRRGFLKTEPGVRYMMYDDGTPFFYLGDTHWTMLTEEFDSAGSNAGELKIDSHFRYIVQRRAQQGFTVYQSEPIGCRYTLQDGFDEADVAGFQDADRYFACIADAGLVHANAQLVFTSELIAGDLYKNEAYLEKLARYWVARYSAYPVLWTTAQECDKDFYHERGDQKVWDANTNPWKKIAAWVAQYDPYQHPLTAHMEHATYTSASDSSFRNVPGHTWYGVQYSFDLSGDPDYKILRDFWENSDGKVVINYEGKYDHLWTKAFGARAVGWMSFLGGMYGYGYGVQDMWYYKCVYDMQSTSSDGADQITPEDKKVQWHESLEFESAAQVNYMRLFLQRLEWWRLTPDFSSDAWYMSRNDLAVSAHVDDALYVVYLYSKNTSAGYINSMDANGVYTAQWFNPRTGEYTLIAEDIRPAERLGSYMWAAPARPDAQDWVLLVTKNA